jgi:hypothetical protein
LLCVKQGAWELEGFAAILFTRDRIHGMEDVIMIKLAST